MADSVPDGIASQEELAAFVRGYLPGHVARIQFAWNGKHAREFVDANEPFRAAVLEYVRAHPGEASAELLTDLYKECASCSREAWCSPRGFEEIAAALLARRGEDALPDFRWGIGQSFDVFGAVHRMKLDPALAVRLRGAAEAAIATASPEDQGAWEELRDLFAGLAAGTATRGWASIDPGTPVHDVRVVPRWEVVLRTAWTRLISLVSRIRT